MSVWIYVDTNKQLATLTTLRCSPMPTLWTRWFEKNDPEGVAFKYEVLTQFAKADQRTADPLPSHSRNAPDRFCGSVVRAALIADRTNLPLEHFPIRH
jgi:hypothetical protein